MSFQVGELCWGKMKGHPHWPCLIESITSNNKYKVVFLGDRTCSASLYISQLKQYKENFQMFSSTTKKKQLIDAIEESFDYEGYEHLKREFQQNNNKKTKQKIAKKVKSEKVSFITEFKIDQNEEKEQQNEEVLIEVLNVKKIKKEQINEYPLVKLQKLDEDQIVESIIKIENIQKTEEKTDADKTSPQYPSENKLQIFLSQKLLSEMIIFHKTDQPIFLETLCVLLIRFLNDHIEDPNDIKKLIQIILYGIRNQLIQLEEIVDVALSMKLTVYYDFVRMIQAQKNELEFQRTVKHCQNQPVKIKYLLY